MDLTYAQLSSAGPVRPNNEDYLGFWCPADQHERELRGSIVVIADGVGGHGQGEVASKLAVETALKTFQEAKLDQLPQTILRQVFNTANVAVYDAGLAQREEGRMATTLTVSIFRGNQVHIGHVADSRAYVLQQGKIRRLTTDHSYVGLQVKLGLVTEEEAQNSPMRSVLTRSVGNDQTVRVDLTTINVNKGDLFIHCTDGLYTQMKEDEMLALAQAPGKSPEELCRDLIALAEARGTEDNLSVQVVRIDKVEQISYYRGTAAVVQQQRQPASDEIQIGQLFDDRFMVTDVIGRSGMATIYKALDQQTNQTVALKIPFMQFESDPGFYSRFQREEAIGLQLQHPYIIHMVEVAKKSRPYLAMEFLEGQTLAQLLGHVRPLPVADAVRIASRLCEALQYMHERDIVHRDFKPQNIMLCGDGSLRIMDFGIAKAAGMRRITFTGFSPTLGTPDYMAPEQVKGKRGDARTDIYSLGAMLYEMAAGKVPFDGNNPYEVMNARIAGDPAAPRKLNPEVSPQVEEIILHAMERQPDDRYPSAAAMKADLDAPERVEVTGRAQRLQTPQGMKLAWRKLRGMFIAFAAPVVIVVILLAVYLLTRHH